MATFHIYVLALEEDCYFVGRTQNLNEEIGRHFAGKEEGWTKIYKPLKVDRMLES